MSGKLLTRVGWGDRGHPLARHISPNKDCEGTLGAVGFGVAAMLVTAHILHVPGSLAAQVVFASVAVVVGRLGDLFESLLKRVAGLKHSSKLIPGHGGMLDRIDALMLAALVFARYYALVVAH